MLLEWVEKEIFDKIQHPLMILKKNCKRNRIRTSLA